MFVLRRTTFRAVSSASHTLLSTPRAARSLTTRAAVPFRHPLVPSSFFQRRFVSDDASKEVAAADETAASEGTTAAPEDTAVASEETATTSPVPAGATSSLYIGNLYFELTEEQLKEHLSAIGPVKDVKLIRDSRGLSKGFGFIQFEDTKDAATAVDTLDQTILEGRRMTVQWHVPRGSIKSPRKEVEPTSTLFIGNMSFEMSDKELNELFRKVRNVTDVRVAIDRRTGQPRGFAHADFTDVESATKAKEYLNGQEIHNRKLMADFAFSSRDVKHSGDSTSGA